MNDTGYIKIHRSFLKWEWHDLPVMASLFLHLIILANWKDARYHGKDIPRGSFLTSIPALAKAVGCHESTIKRGLKRLQETGEIDVKTSHAGTHIFVHNYAVYQDNANDGWSDRWSDERTDKRSDQCTDERSDRWSTIEEYKEEQEEKEIKNKTILTSFFELYPKQLKKKEAEAELKRLLDEGTDENEIMNGLDQWLEYWETFTEDQQRYIPNPYKWLTEKRWQQPVPNFNRKKKDKLPDWYDSDPNRKGSGEKVTDEDREEFKNLMKELEERTKHNE